MCLSVCLCVFRFDTAVMVRYDCFSSCHHAVLCCVAHWLQAVNVRNFPFHRGVVVGLIKSFFGLSASNCWRGCLFDECCAGVVAQVYAAFFEPKPVPFLMFLGVGMSALGLLCG